MVVFVCLGRRWHGLKQPRRVYETRRSTGSDCAIKTRGWCLSYRYVAQFNDGYTVNYIPPLPGKDISKP